MLDSKYYLTLFESLMSENPKQLFKFRSWPNAGENRTKELLEEGTIYCSTPREFDDPHDSQLGAFATGSPLDMDRWLNHDMREPLVLMRKYRLSSISELFELADSNEEVRETMEKMRRLTARRNSRVICFSGEWANELMWAFYADNHRGLCLCFDTKHEFLQNAKPVVYSHSPADVEHLVDSEAETDHMAYCKSLAWQFQKEWRIVFLGNEPKKVQFPKESLSAVILGYRFPESEFENLKDVLVKGGYLVKIFTTERIPNSYELKLVERGEVCQS